MGDVTTAFAEDYRAGITMLHQQLESKLMNAVSSEGKIEGSVAYFDFIAPMSMRSRGARNSDTQHSLVDWRKRMVGIEEFYLAALLDYEDAQKMLVDPTSKIMQTFKASAQRKIDETIITAFDASVSTGFQGASTTTFTAGNSIAHGSANITIAKILQAARILDENDVPQEDRYFVAHPRQKEAMMAITQVTSSDYNNIRALVKGELDTFYGFKWIWSNLLARTVSGAGYQRENFAWHKGSMARCVQGTPQAYVDRLPEKKQAFQPWYSFMLSAVRLQETGVVRIYEYET